MKPDPSRTLFLVDGFNLLYRSYFALRHLTDAQGNPVNAVYGFTTTLQKLLHDWSPRYLGVAFDPEGPTFRHEQYAEYKAQREPMPEPLAAQIPVAREVLEALDIPLLLVEGFEADDVIATLCREARERDLDVVIVSADKDLYQLVREHVWVLNPRKDFLLMGAAEVEQEFGVRPDQVVSVLALVGDAVDNVPGVPGIGEKGAVKLVQEFGSLANLLEHTEQVQRKGYRESLQQNREAAEFSRRLVEIPTDVPLPLNLDALRVGPPHADKAAPLFMRLGFRKLLADLAPQEAETVSAERLERAGEVRDWLKNHPAPRRAWICESADAATGYEQAWNLAVCAHGDSAVLRVGEAGIEAAAAATLLAEEADPLLYGGKHWLKLGLAGGQVWDAPADDVRLAAYLVNAGRPRYDVESLALDYLGERIAPAAEDGPSQPSLMDAPAGEAGAPSALAARARLLQRLMDELAPRLERDRLTTVYRELELPLLPVLAHMESAGMAVDTGRLQDLAALAAREMERLEKEIHGEAGEAFNIQSPRQLGEILFEKMKLPVVKKTRKTGGWSTDSEVLEALAESHAMPRLVLEYRNLAKLKGTYLDALPRQVNARTGRIHSCFHQTVAATGRLSSSDPNLQNIPIRTELGRQVRTAFIAPPGRVLVGADYSQIELRVLAHLSGDASLCDAFRKGEDIHTRTAADVEGVAAKDVTSDMRRRAKVINFGILYGMGAFRLAKDLGITQREAQAFIDAYFARFPSVESFIRATEAAAEEKGFVATLDGRRRPFPELGTARGNERQALLRQAVNAVVQGTAADIMKRGMIAVFAWMRSAIPGGRMVLQVHDEVVLEVPEQAAEAACDGMRRHLQGAASLDVPLVVDVHTARDWGALK